MKILEGISLIKLRRRRLMLRDREKRRGDKRWDNVFMGDLGTV